MPCLELLNSNPEASERFVQEVLSLCRQFSEHSVDTGPGIRTTEELTEHLINGRDCPFDYSKLIFK